ncbi:MAG: zinc-ribbon domain-containing protein [Polyangiales bacterium]
MDVTCERCGTEYEFDETLLSGRGTTVKCTNCGHVFRVYPSLVEGGDGTTSYWKIRYVDTGRVEIIESLKDLQRAITNGSVIARDEISRADDDWKPLGTIAELETFFAAAHRPSFRPMENEPPRTAARRASKTLVGAAPVPKIQQDALTAPRPSGSPRARSQTILGTGADYEPPTQDTDWDQDRTPSVSPPGWTQPSIPPVRATENPSVVSDTRVSSPGERRASIPIDSSNEIVSSTPVFIADDVDRDSFPTLPKRSNRSLFWLLFCSCWPRSFSGSVSFCSTRTNRISARTPIPPRASPITNRSTLSNRQRP